MSEASLRGKVAVIGIGQSPVGRVPGRSPLWLAADAARKAIADAGLKKTDIDGVLSSHAFASPFHRFSVAFSEYFGLQPTFSNTLQVSGATAAAASRLATAGSVARAPALVDSAATAIRAPADRVPSLEFRAAIGGCRSFLRAFCIMYGPLTVQYLGQLYELQKGIQSGSL